MTQPPPPPPPPPPPTGPATTPAGNGGVPAVRPLLDIGEWLTDTTRTLVHGFGEFFAVLAIVSLLATAGAAPLLWLGSRTATLTRSDSGLFESVEGLTAGQGAMVGGGLLVLVIAQLLLFTAATVHVDRVRRGERPRWQDSLLLGLRRLPRVVAVIIQVVMIAVLLTILVGILATVLPGAAVVAGPASLGLMAVLWVRSAVAPTHAGLDLPGSSVRASLVWSRRRVWPLLGRHVLLLTIVLGILLISSFVAAPFQSLGGARAGDGDVVLRDLVGSSVPAFVGNQFVNALASGLVAAVWASAMLSLHRSEPAES